MKLNRKQLQEVKRMYKKLTNKELLIHLTENFNYTGGLTSLRAQLYQKGFKKCHMLRWTKQESQFLLDHYQTTGNIEIAKQLTQRGRKFTKKNVEKKMRLLGVTRTKEDLDYIREQHRERGVYHIGNLKMWKKRGIAVEGERRIWVNNGIPRSVIKVNGSFTPYARHRYTQLYGNVPEGCKVYFKDNNPLNVKDENLIALPAGALTVQDRLEYRRHIKNYLNSLKADQEENKPIEPQKTEKPKQVNTIPVRINSKTVVFVKPGTNISQLKERMAINHY